MNESFVKCEQIEFVCNLFAEGNLRVFLSFISILIAPIFLLYFSKALWVGIIHHVCNIHTWTMGSCQHSQLEEAPGREWIQRDSKCHTALVDIVLNKRWQKMSINICASGKVWTHFLQS